LELVSEYADAFGAMDFANIYSSLEKQDLQAFEKLVDGERYVDS
jgi:hypothetical protein